ncbi:MAG: bifunctional riboflavin kinase/FAD synthetase [Bacteroidota bacterium]|jgi:riboflavin kinase/FMN adenylyltransferase
MHILYGYDHVPHEIRGATLAIGNFDGVHRGHQALFQAAREAVAHHGGLAGVMVFEPHPREFFQPDKPHFRLTTLPQKLALFERYGLELAVVLTFDQRLAELTAYDFIERILVAGLGVRHVIVGGDFHFGKGRDGNAKVMSRAGKEFGFEVTVVETVAEAGEVFSSSAIRADIAQGDVASAAQALGHYWRVAGKVVGGAKRGTGLGFPTANIHLAKGTALAHGIYAVFVYVHGERSAGAAYLGTRPTFDNGEPILEVFLLDFEGDLYGREIEVEFIDYIRGDRRFETIEALKEQIEKDVARSRQILARAKP